MAKRLTPEAAVVEIAKRVRGEKRVFVPGGCAEPIALREAWRANPEAAAELLFCGVFLPGINTFDYSALHPSARLDLFLMIPELRDAYAAGRATLTPAHYSQAGQLIADRPLAAAIVHVSAQDGNKRCSFGLAADLGPLVVGRADLTVALVNKQMPFVEESPTFPLSAADIIVEVDAPLATAKPQPPAAGAAAIAAHVASLVRDDDVVQIGIGRLPTAILAALAQKKRLRIFSGMVSDGLLPLLQAGDLVDEPGAITTGMAIGSAAFYARLAKEPRLKMTSVSHTHAHNVISRIEMFVSINACLEVDLFGQVNAEFAGAQQIASVGGLADFVRGARAAPGGRAIVALHAEGKGGETRIVPRLAEGAVTLSRHDAPIVVTEHGAADLDSLDTEGRVEALIGVAAPAHRETLRAAWARMRKGF